MGKGLRKSRQSAALYTVWKHGKISRGKLARVLDLKISAISILVGDLIRSGKVIEGGVADSTGGRKARLLEIAPSWGWVIGLELSSRGIVSAASDMKGSLFNLKRSPFARDWNRKKILQRIITSLRSQIGYAHRRDRNPIYRIGIGISGLVDETSGVSIGFPRLGDWRDVPLKSLIEKEFGIPVVVENRITATTLAEHLFGDHKNAKDALFFHLGPGLGMGIVLNGKVRRGTKWSVGEFGHIAVIEDGPLCYCGCKGCLESIASDFALVAQAKEAIKNGVNTRILEFTGQDGEITSRAICQAAADGDRLAHGLIEKAGYYLATGVANVLNVLGPEVILFAGTMVERCDALLDCIKRNLRVHTLEYIEEHVEIARATFGSEGGIRGALILALHDFYSNPEVSAPSPRKKRKPTDGASSVGR